MIKIIKLLLTILNLDKNHELMIVALCSYQTSSLVIQLKIKCVYKSLII